MFAQKFYHFSQLRFRLNDAILFDVQYIVKSNVSFITYRYSTLFPRANRFIWRIRYADKLEHFMMSNNECAWLTL